MPSGLRFGDLIGRKGEGLCSKIILRTKLVKDATFYNTVKKTWCISI